MPFWWLKSTMETKAKTESPVSKKNSHDTVEALEKKISIKFKNKKLIEEALTHKSYAMEKGSGTFNERLEFLGDSILNAVITEFLFKRYPEEDEGKLSKLKSHLVAKPPLIRWGKEIKIGQFIRMSVGEALSGGRERDSIIANTMESLIGAIFLDHDFEKSKEFILKKFSQIKRIVETDYKSRLQEIIQKKYRVPPTYVLVEETGPDHDKTFNIEVKINKKILGSGTGKSKKESEQAAAQYALRKMRSQGIKT